MATLADTYSWALNETELKTYLGISLTDTSEDTQLELWLGSAIEIGDMYLGNYFTDDDTEDGTDTAHPTAIRIGLYEYVKNMRADLAMEPGVGAIKEGEVQINYLLTLQVAYFQEGLPPNVRRYWFPWKKGILR